jgi:hypothetical protein
MGTPPSNVDVDAMGQAGSWRDPVEVYDQISRSDGQGASDASDCPSERRKVAVQWTSRVVSAYLSGQDSVIRLRGFGDPDVSLGKMVPVDVSVASMHWRISFGFRFRACQCGFRFARPRGGNQFIPDYLQLAFLRPPLPGGPRCSPTNVTPLFAGVGGPAVSVD